MELAKVSSFEQVKQTAFLATLYGYSFNKDPGIMLG